MPKRSERRRRQAEAAMRRASGTAGYAHRAGQGGIGGPGPVALPWPAERANPTVLGLAIPEWGVVVLLLVVLEIALTAIGGLASSFGPREPFQGNWSGLVMTGTNPLTQLLSNWQRWDALWYQHIAQTGYQANNGSTAFFPLYPALSRITSFALLGNIVLAELAVAAGAFVAGMWLLWKLTALELPSLLANEKGERQPLVLSRQAARVPLLTVLLTALFPTGFFFLAPYTEGLFLLLTLASFWLARRGQLWAAGGIGFLAGLTRTQGIFLVLPLAYEHLRQRGSIQWLSGRGGHPPSSSLLAATLPAAGVAAFYIFQIAFVGEHQSGLGAQALWGYQITAPWDALAASLKFISTVNDSRAQIETFNLICLLAFSGVAVAAARRLPLAYTLYSLPSLALLFTRDMYFSPLMSVSRYVLVVFPCFMMVAFWLRDRPKLAGAWLILSVLVQLTLFQYYVRWGFVA